MSGMSDELREELRKHLENCPLGTWLKEQLEASKNKQHDPAFGLGILNNE